MVFCNIQRLDVNVKTYESMKRILYTVLRGTSFLLSAWRDVGAHSARCKWSCG